MKAEGTPRLRRLTAAQDRDEIPDDCLSEFQLHAPRSFLLSTSNFIPPPAGGRPLGDSAFVVMNVPEPGIGVKQGSPVAAHPQRIKRSGKVLAGGKSFVHLQGLVVEGRLVPAGNFIWTSKTNVLHAPNSLQRQLVAVITGRKGEKEGVLSLISGEVMIPPDTFWKIRFRQHGRSGWML